MTRPVEVRARLVETFRRDLVGPGIEDEDLARERLAENPSRWYLTGFIAPSEDEPTADDPAVQEEEDREAESETGSGAGGAPAMTSRARRQPRGADFCRPRSVSLCCCLSTSARSKRE
jgi:hypothetical protein